MAVPTPVDPLESLLNPVNTALLPVTLPTLKTMATQEQATTRPIADTDTPEVATSAVVPTTQAPSPSAADPSTLLQLSSGAGILMNSNLGCSTNYLFSRSYYCCSFAYSLEFGSARGAHHLIDHSLEQCCPNELVYFYIYLDNPFVDLNGTDLYFNQHNSFILCVLLDLILSGRRDSHKYNLPISARSRHLICPRIQNFKCERSSCELNW